MKRIHLFEFEDLSWFPHWIRSHMTNMLNAVHRLLGTPEVIAALLAPLMQQTKQHKIVDVCSGSGGPMKETLQLLKEEYGLTDMEVTLTDLYPNLSIAKKINETKDGLSYLPTPVNATTIDSSLEGVRTMICSFHHMPPDTAVSILRNMQESNQPFLLYEISDNSMPPTFLWWMALPFNVIFALIVGLFTRPFTWQQFLFTYIIPIFPIFFAWDGAVSNTRTYTLSDLVELLQQLPTSDYTWEKGIIKGKAGNQLYMKGIPV